MVKWYLLVFLSRLRDNFLSSYWKGRYEYQATFSVRFFKGNKIVATTQTSDIKSHNRAPVAQLVEHRALTREVVSSTPAGPSLRVLK